MRLPTEVLRVYMRGKRSYTLLKDPSPCPSSVDYGNTKIAGHATNNTHSLQSVEVQHYFVRKKKKKVWNTLLKQSPRRVEGRRKFIFEPSWETSCRSSPMNIRQNHETMWAWCHCMMHVYSNHDDVRIQWDKKSSQENTTCIFYLSLYNPSSTPSLLIQAWNSGVTKTGTKWQSSLQLPPCSLYKT